MCVRGACCKLIIGFGDVGGIFGVTEKNEGKFLV
jgi:hypothetical protein